MSGNLKYLWLLALFLLTAATAPNVFNLSMTFLTGFFIAYLGKGLRKTKVK